MTATISRILSGVTQNLGTFLGALYGLFVVVYGAVVTGGSILGVLLWFVYLGFWFREAYFGVANPITAESIQVALADWLPLPEGATEGSAAGSSEHRIEHRAEGSSPVTGKGSDGVPGR